MEKNSANKFELGQNELITLDYFDSESDVDVDGIKYAMYYYSNYRIATRITENEVTEPYADVRLVLTSENHGKDFPIKIRSIEDAIKIINIIEGR